jgi:hypothetical protein
MRGSALSLATFMGPFEPSFATEMGTTWLPVMGTPGVSCRAVLAGAAAQRASVLIAGPLGLCYLPTFLCLGIVPVVAGLAGDVLAPGRMSGRIARQLSRGPAADPERDSWEERRWWET